MSGKKSGAESERKWKMPLPGAGAGSKGTDGGKRKRERRASGGAVGGAALTGEMQAMFDSLEVKIGKRVSGAREGIEEAIRVHVDQGAAGLGGAMKTMLESVEKLARDWKEAISAVSAEDTEEVEEGQDGKSGKKTKTENRAAALKKVIDEFAGRVRTLHSDVKRAHEAQRKSVSVAAVVCVLLAAPVLLGIGLVVQQELGLLPEPERVEEQDETGGWRSYVWAKYGQAIIECEREAENRGAALVCELAVGQ